MSFHEISFLILLLILALGYSFYLVGMAIITRLRPQAIEEELNPRDQGPWPCVHILVATFNENLLIENKVRNALFLAYPKEQRKIWIIDGGSNDGTLATLDRLSAELGDQVRVIKSSAADKICQLNLALEQIPKEDIVVISDADALIGSELALQSTAAALAREEIGVVGGWTNPHPRSTIQAEIAYWDKQNRLRYLEAKTFSATAAVSPYIAFRRGLIQLLPEDCVADDIFISYRSHLRGKRILYSPTIQVTELRASVNITQMFRHKLRKAHAYTTELFRVLYLLPHMPKRLKFMYLFKLYQFFYLPWIFCLISLESLILLAEGEFALVFGGYCALVLALLVASLSLSPPRGLKRGGFEWKSVIATLQSFSLMNLVLMTNSLIFPFWRQKASYEKVGQ